MSVESTSENTSESAACLLRVVQAMPTARAFIVIDGCQAYDFVQQAQQGSQPARSLFKGAMAGCDDVQPVAPYMLETSKKPSLLISWCNYWGKNAGIIVTTSAPPRELFRHLRNIFVVKDESGQEFFFRFYDPRVLRVYLATCTEPELTEFFGPIESILLENQDHNALLQYTCETGKLKTWEHAFE